MKLETCFNPVILPLRFLSFHYRFENVKSLTKKIFFHSILLGLATISTLPIIFHIFKIVKFTATELPLLYGPFFMNVVATIWMIQSLGSFCTCVYMFHSGTVDRFLVELTTLDCFNDSTRIKLRHRAVICCFCIALYSIFSAGTTVLTVLGFMREAFTIGGLPHSVNVPLMMAWASVIWPACACFYYLVSYAVTLEGKYVLKLIKDGPLNVCIITLQHVSFIKLVTKADSMLKRYACLMLVISIPVAVFQLYAMALAQDLMFYTRMQIGFWFFGQLCHIILISLAGEVNLVAEEFSNALYVRYIDGLNNGDLDGRTVQQIGIVLNQFSTAEIGFSFWDLFIIKRSTMTTMLSLVVTYFILVIQFVNPNVAVVTDPHENMTKT